MPGSRFGFRSLRGLILGAGLGFLLIGSVDAQEARHLRHILVPSEEAADALMRRLESGADFKELARKYSFDVGTRPLGGDLEWVLPQTVEVEFARAAFGIADKGGLAKAKTRHGWHVIEYVDSRPAPEAKPIPPEAPEPATTPAGGADRVPVPPVGTDRNEDLRVRIDWGKITFAPEEPIRFSIEIENTTDRPIDVFHPDLWPLGLIVRYQFGKLNQTLALPESWGGTPPGGLSTTLAGGEKIERTFVLQDYFGARESWPIIRMIWRGDTLFGRLEKLLPTVMQAEDYPIRKGRWRYYISPESRVNVLPDYRPGERWYLCLYSRGRTWVEIRDPGVPGLVERLIRMVREGDYDEQPFAQFVPDDFMAVVMPEQKPLQKFADPTRAIEWSAGTVGLAIELLDGRPIIGTSLCVGLPDPRVIRDRAVPVGRIVRSEGDPERRILEILQGGGTSPLSLALAYPEDLAPPEVVEAARALPHPGKLSTPIRPDPTAGWKPVINSRSRAQLQGRESRLNPERTPPKEPSVRKPAKPIAPDLPQVKIDTNKGSIVVTLFEDDAPNTVANFVHLVESGFYGKNEILRKLSNAQNLGFLQTGSPDNTVNGQPGYAIKDEVNGRNHERGSLSMARKHTVPNSAGSQFLICLADQPQLDGTYTVFGMVTKGMDVVDRLEVGDVIQTMEVTQKRPHEYRPETIPR